MIVPFLTLILIATQANANADVCTSSATEALQFKTWAEEFREKAPVRLDPAKLRAWDAQGKLPCSAPFLATYTAEGKTLMFLATDHTNQPVTPDHPMLDSLSKVIEKTKPNAILIEMKTGGVEFPPEAIERVLNTPNCFQNGEFSCGESGWAALKAKNNKIPVFGAEPPLSELMTGKFDRTQLKGFVAVRAALSLKRAGVPQANWSEELKREMQKDLPDIGAYTIQDFEIWRKTAHEKSLEQIEPSAIEPRTDKSASVLQRFAAIIDQEREKKILEKTAQIASANRTTLVVYGFAHFYKQQKAFEAKFGRAKIECLAR